MKIKSYIVIVGIFFATNSFANSSDTLNKIVSEIENKKDSSPIRFTDILKDETRADRKEICKKLMVKYEDSKPKVAFQAGNCLLYNGYGKEAIPLFTKYLFNEYNEKYFNKRIGYGWLHATNWYKVDEKVLSEMLEGLDFYAWVTKEIDKEIKLHTDKYGEKALASLLKKKFVKDVEKNPLTKKETNIFKTCQNMEIYVDGYRCKFTKNRKDKLESCTEVLSKKSLRVKCMDDK